MINIKNITRYLVVSLWNHFICYIPSYKLRWFILKYCYRASLSSCNIHMGVKFFSPWKLKVGQGSNIQYGSFIDCRGGVVIGNNTDITLMVKIISQDHDVDSNEYTTRSSSVNIGDNCIIGSFSVLLPGSNIEDGGVLGASSVLLKTVKKNKLYAGNPCREIRDRRLSDTYKCSYKRPFH